MKFIATGRTLLSYVFLLALFVTLQACGGGGGGAGGNGGAVVLIISNLSQFLITDSKIIVEVTGGTGGARGLANGDVTGGASSNHGIAGTTGSSGSNLTQVV